MKYNIVKNKNIIIFKNQKGCIIMIILDDYRNSDLIVNRVKTTEKGDLAIHVNRKDGCRTNGWIIVDDTMILRSRDGSRLDWNTLEDDTYYRIRTMSNENRTSAILTGTLFDE